MKINFSISYQEFIENFYDKKRIEKPLNLETFGNCQCNSMSEKQKISFKTKNHYFNYENKIVSNGYGISLDKEFSEIITLLKQGDEFTLEHLLKHIPEDKKEKISELIWQLSYIGVLKISE